MAAVFAAVLDTNVLYPSLQRDFLLSLAIVNLYRPLWSERILEELHRHELFKKRRYGAAEEVATRQADRLVEQLRTHFDDAIVRGWEGLEGSFGLRDPDDEHVVAAAVVGGAGAIVTENFKDLDDYRVPGHIEVLHANEFAADTAEVDPGRAVRALIELANRRRAPHIPPRQLLELLVERYDMDDLGEILAPVLDGLAT